MYSRQAILVIAIIFISVRLIMGVALLSEETETNHLNLVVDVLSALAGLAAGTLWFLYRTRSRIDKH
jgi:heme/copper-type cytochrome/quinol oxidase subunit 4